MVKINSLLVIIIVILTKPVIAQIQNFPTAYEGIWEGELKTYNPTNAQQPVAGPINIPKVTMQLEISKNDSAHCWNFILRYISQGVPGEKKYLLKKDSFSGSYIFIEQNIIKLYSYLMDNVLIEHFSLPENDITTIYKFGVDTIYTQMTSSEVAPITWTGGVKGIPKIFSYLVVGYQDAVLVRKKR